MRNRLSKILSSVFGPNGLEREELLIVLGLLLIATGLWNMYRPAAYVVPGVVILWIALPMRSSFIVRPPLEAEKPSRRKV